MTGRLAIVPPAEGRDPETQIFLLIAAARATLASFRGEIEAGTLRPPQHASMRLLEEALHPLQEVPAEDRPK